MTKTIEIIERFHLIHINKFDYSKVVYKKMTDKICIICPIHGEFWQTPFCHMQSTHGCPICGENAKTEK